MLIWGWPQKWEEDRFKYLSLEARSVFNLLTTKHMMCYGGLLPGASRNGAAAYSPQPHAARRRWVQFRPCSSRQALPRWTDSRGHASGLPREKGSRGSVLSPFPGIPRVGFRCPGLVRSLSHCSGAVKRFYEQGNIYKVHYPHGGITVAHVALGSVAEYHILIHKQRGWA